MIKIINFAFGLIIGGLIVFFINLNNSENVQENILSVPSELPKDNIKFELIEIPKDLKEVKL